MLATCRRLLPAAVVRRPLPARFCSSSGATRLAALIERSPQLTPDPTEAEELQQAFHAAQHVRQRKYPAVLTAAEEGPDQERARQRMEAIVEEEGSREGDGDRSGDMRSMDRCLAQRLYLLVQVDGQWELPQMEWQPPESARDGLRRAIEARCGGELNVHQMGNAPLGHVELSGGTRLFLWRFLYVSGDVVSPGDDYAWVTQQELAERVDDNMSQLTNVVTGPYP